MSKSPYSEVEFAAAQVSAGLIDKPRPPVPAFSIFDVKAAAFMPPFLMPTNAMAIRAFGQDVKNPQSNFAKFPEDFTLHHVGYFDDANGMFMPVKPVEISRASNFVE